MTNSPRYPQRVRNDLRFRELTVLRVERISAGFQRIVLGGEALDGYTPLYDEQRHELAIDFFIHDGGVASGWAMQAQPGDKLTVAGPRGSLVVPEDYAYQVYVCDESGMPALRRRLETLSKLAVKPQVTALVSVRDNACQDYLAHLDGFNIEWLTHDEQAVDARLAQLAIPADDYFIWITGEGKVVKNLSRRFEAEQYDPQRVRAAAYWHAK